jgi:hypothetical protein
VENIRSQESTIQEGEKLARDYTELESLIARFLKSNRAKGSGPVHIRKKERKDRTTKDTPPPPSSSPVRPAEPPRPKAEEEEDRAVPFESFQKLYAPGRLDSAKAQPLFDALTPAERKAALSWLEQHRACPRWLDQAGRWIPLASTFLREKQFLHPPPPAFDAAANGVQTPISRFDRKAQDFQRRYRAEQEKKSRGS